MTGCASGRHRNANANSLVVAIPEVVRSGHHKIVPRIVQLAFARPGAKERGERDDDWRRSDESYSPRRHWRFRSPTRSVGPRFAYRRVMTLVSSDDLDWGVVFDSRIGHLTGPRRNQWRRDPRNGASNCLSCNELGCRCRNYSFPRNPAR
jgi:hypothetical protein